MKKSNIVFYFFVSAFSHALDLGFSVVGILDTQANSYHVEDYSFTCAKIAVLSAS
jgi:hypothetical protein